MLAEPDTQYQVHLAQIVLRMLRYSIVYIVIFIVVVDIFFEKK